MSKIVTFLIIIAILIIVVVGISGGSDTSVVEGIETKIIDVIETPAFELSIPSDAIIYELDSDDTELIWSASRITGASNTGTVDVKNGIMYKLNDEFVQGLFLVDVSSFSEAQNNEIFINHVKSADFFDVKNYPTAGIIITNLDKDDNDEDLYKITADITIKGITKEIVFPARIIEDEDEGTVIAQALFKIDRTKWGIIFDSGSFFKNLGDKAIKDEIEFDLTLVLHPQEI